MYSYGSTLLNRNELPVASADFSCTVPLPDNSLECEVELEEPRANGDGVVDVVLVALDFCQRDSGDNER